VIVESLESMGYRVGEAASALEAANRIRAAGDYFEAVVIDIGLPDRRGDALAADLRAMHARLPIIIASGYAESPLQVRFKKDPRFRFLMKPYDSQQLHEALLSMHVKPRERASGQS
jgi:DNA-binding NtrC family response regulator